MHRFALKELHFISFYSILLFYSILFVSKKTDQSSPNAHTSPNKCKIIHHIWIHH